MPDPTHQILAAQAHAAAGRWEAAAAAWEAVAQSATARRDAAATGHALGQAADALRRDDRPARAAKQYHAAIALCAPGEARRGLLRAGLASVLMEAGEPVPAEIATREALAEAADPGLRLVLLDLLLGALVVLGRVAEADGPLAEMSALVAGLPPAAQPIAGATLSFRRAVRHRLRGELRAAAALAEAAQTAMEGRKETVGAAAAASAERAEQALAQGDGAGAARHLDHAARLWTVAGRRAGLYRAEAGLVRAALAQGQTPLATSLQGPIAYAHDRGLPLLEAELRLTRGLARARAGVRGAEEDLDQAVALAERASACLLEGRARLLRRRAGFLRNDLDRTRACLAGDAIWAAAAALPQPGEREPW